jgi:hypothetical protein
MDIDTHVDSPLIKVLPLDVVVLFEVHPYSGL